MPATPQHSLSDLEALPANTKPRYSYLKSLVQWVQTAINDIAANGWDNSANPNAIDTARAITTAGTSTAYTATFTPAFTAYSEGVLLKVRWHVASGNNPTINVDGLGPLALVKPDGSNVASGDLTLDNSGLVQINTTLSKAVVVSSLPISVGMTYTEHVAGANLAASSENIDKSGTNTHILPELSTMTDGVKVTMLITGADHKVAIKEHANDSNAETWTGVVVGAFVHFIVVDGAWAVSQEHSGHYARIYLSADESVAGSASEKLTTWVEDVDTGGIYDATTDYEFEIPFDCWFEIDYHIANEYGGMSPAVKVGATYWVDPTVIGSQGSTSRTTSDLSARWSLNSGDTVELWGKNTLTSSLTAGGDANKDESQCTVTLTRRRS